MAENRTYTKWKKELREEFVQHCKVNDISQNDVESISQDISKLLQNRSFDKDAKNAMLYGFYDPLVGLRSAEKKMNDWHKIVTAVEGVCERDDGSLFHCPENITTEKRLLSLKQDSAMLLLTILFLHEGLYKNMVNFIYNLTGHGKIKDDKTVQQADHLANANFDIRGVVDRELRNSIAHMTFRVMDNGNVWVSSSTSLPPGYDAASGKEPPGAKEYSRDQLASAHDKSRAELSDLYTAIQHWFNCNYGPLSLFDDAFFETPEGNEIRKKARLEMVNKPNIDHWERVMKRAREELQRVTSKRA